MSNVLNFPNKPDRDWHFIEKSMRDGFSRTVIQQSAQERILDRLKEFHKILYPDFDFSISIEFPNNVSREQSVAILAQIGEKVGARNSEKIEAFTNQLWADRIKCEFDFCEELGIL